MCPKKRTLTSKKVSLCSDTSKRMLRILPNFHYLARTISYYINKNGGNFPRHSVIDRIIYNYKTINKVPAVIRIEPIKDLDVNFSCKNTKASTSVITTLSLSTGTTFDASPI